MATQYSSSSSSQGRCSNNTLRKKINLLIGMNMKRKQIANQLGMSDYALKRKLRNMNITMRMRYTRIDEEVIKQLVDEMLSINQNLGEKSIRSRLRVMGVNVQRWRVRAVLKTISNRRHTKPIERRSYYVRAPLSMLHMDGYQKLIRWRFMVHGAVDGKSRLVYFIKLSDNNRATTVLRGFKEGARLYGFPSRVRTDKGRENMLVADLMLNIRGTDRGSIITGRSVHNVRVERFWRELRRCCIQPFRDIFIHLENEGFLDAKNELDLFCLHYCFTQVISNEIDVFADSWNVHGLRTEGNETPEILFYTGLSALRNKSEENREVYTELCQPDGVFEDSFYESDSHSSDEDEELRPKVYVPRIQFSLTAEEMRRLQRRFPQRKIHIKNADTTYVNVRDYVISRFL